MVGLEREEMDCLMELYSILYGDEFCSDQMLQTVVPEFKAVSVGGEVFGSVGDVRRRLWGKIVASWFDSFGEIALPTMSYRAGTVKRYIKHSVIVGSELKYHVFAVVSSWNKPYLVDHGFLSPVTVIHQRKYEELSFASFLPVQRINCKYIGYNDEVAGDNISVIMPVDRKWMQ